MLTVLNSLQIRYPALQAALEKLLHSATMLIAVAFVYALASYIDPALRNSGIAPALVELELTESMIMRDP